MFRGESRALGSDGPREAAGMATDDVDLPFAQDGFAVLRIGDGALRFIEGIQDARA